MDQQQSVSEKKLSADGGYTEGFSQCLRIARDIPVYELRRPLHTQTVEQLADMIFHLMDGIK